MVQVRLVAAAVALLLAFSLAPGGNAERTHGGRYIAGTGLIAIWCDTHTDPILPVGDPDDHPSPVGWLHSGDPECAPTNTLNDLDEGTPPEEHGLGGFAWELLPTEHGSWVAVSAHDDVFRAAPFLTVFIDGPDEDSLSERCGPSFLPIPHWPFPGPQEPEPYLMWSWIPVVAADEDLNFCVASSGRAVATIGLPAP